MSTHVGDPRPKLLPWQRWGWVVVLAIAFALGEDPHLAHAHERRVIGQYVFVVGFIGEPALVGEPNGIDLKVTRADSGEPVIDVEKTVKAQIAFGGGAPKAFPLRARFGVPGAYTADIIPTKPGAYLFTFTGTLGTVAIQEVFESGPNRFSDVVSSEALQFPEVVAQPAGLANAVRQAEARTTASEATVSALGAEVATARTIAIGGAFAGLVGVVAGTVGLLRGRRS